MAEMNKQVTKSAPRTVAHTWSEPTARKRIGTRVEALDNALKNKGVGSPLPATATGYQPAAEVRSQWQELKEQAVLAFESGLLPRSVDSRQKAITIALMGREFGLSPMQALCGIYVVNGMAALRGSLMLRMIYERVNGAMITVLTLPDRANLECSVEMKRPSGKPHLFRFTLEDARKAGFMNKPIWQQHTATMLRWAAIRTGARVVFADAIAGAYMEDEIAGAGESPQDGVTQPDIPAVPMASALQASMVVETVVAAPGRVEVETPAAPVARTEVRSLPLFKPVTEKQINRLYAIAHGKQWTRQDVGIWMEKWFKKRDPKGLNRIEYDKLCNFLLSSPTKAEKQGNGRDERN